MRFRFRYPLDNKLHAFDAGGMETQTHRSWRRFARFSVRGLIVLVLVIGIVLGLGMGFLIATTRKRPAVDLDRALTAHGLCAAIDSVLPRKERIFDSEAKMDIAWICRCLRVTALVRSFIVQQFKNHSTWELHECSLDRNARDADDLRQIRPVQQLPPKRGRPEETFPERQRNIDAGDAHADMMNRGRGRDPSRFGYCFGQGHLLEFKL